MGTRVQHVDLRRGSPDDAATVAALSVQVFLDTYATDGVRPDLAREALRDCSEQAFLSRLSASTRRFVLAENQAALLGFAELDCASQESPVPGVLGAELARLYVQPQAQGAGVGTALLEEAEKLALSAGVPALWLTVWERNDRALAFYARCGYVDVGATVFTMEGRRYGNRVLARRFTAVSPGDPQAQ